MVCCPKYMRALPFHWSTGSTQTPSTGAPAVLRPLPLEHRQYSDPFHWSTGSTQTPSTGAPAVLRPLPLEHRQYSDPSTGAPAVLRPLPLKHRQYSDPFHWSTGSTQTPSTGAPAVLRPLAQLDPLEDPRPPCPLALRPMLTSLPISLSNNLSLASSSCPSKLSNCLRKVLDSACTLDTVSPKGETVKLKQQFWFSFPIKIVKTFTSGNLETVLVFVLASLFWP